MPKGTDTVKGRDLRAVKVRDKDEFPMFGNDQCPCLATTPPSRGELRFDTDLKSAHLHRHLDYPVPRSSVN